LSRIQNLNRPDFVIFVLLSVHADHSTERERARTIFEEAGAEDISFTEEARV
jgi:hypothetical protein